MVATVAAGAVLGVAACGGADAEERVRDVVSEMQDDIRAGRLGEVCDRMSARSRRQVGSVGHGRQPTTCSNDLRELLRSVREQAAFSGDDWGTPFGRARAKVRGVKTGDGGRTAVATVTLGGDPFDLSFVREGSRWLLDDMFNAVGPTPRPLR